jgi:hypothetical protein
MSTTQRHFIYIGRWAHPLCHENKGCCLCGVAGLTLKCNESECSRVIHYWCAKGYRLLPPGGDIETLNCDLHSANGQLRRRDTNKLPFIKSVCRNISSSSLWEGDYRSKDSPGILYSASLCNGHIFWYIINLEYFPQGLDLTYFPEILPLSSPSTDLPTENGNTIHTDRYIDSLIDSYTAQLTNLNSWLQPLKHQVQTQAEHLDSLKASAKKPLTEEEQILADIKCLKYETLNDEYLKYFEKRERWESVQNTSTESSTSSLRRRDKHKKDEDYICAVCNDTDYEEDDLIVICAVFFI